MSDRRALESGRRRQRGAVAVFAAVALIAILTCAALIIETGRVYLAHRHLQKMASLAALDASRVISGCGNTPTFAALQTAVDQSLDRNGDPENVSSINIEHGIIETSADTSLRSLTPTDLDDADAVRVTLTAPFPDLLTSFLVPTGGIITASATAEQAAVGSLKVGSGLVSINGGILNALLSGLFGGSVDLTVVDYNGLAGVNVTAEQLALALDLEVRDLSDPLTLGAQTPLLSDVLNGLASALADTASATVTNALQDLAAGASGNGNTIPLGDVLGTVGAGAANLPFVNLLDLILALGEAAQPNPAGGPQPIALPISLAIPGVSSLNTFVTILEPAQPSRVGRPGRTSASTAQIQLQLRLQVDAVSNLSTVLTVLLLGTVQVTAPPINLGIDIDVAKATAYLDSLECPTTQNPSPVAELSAESSVATVTLGTFSGNPATAPDLNTDSSLLAGITTKVLFGLGPTIITNVFLANPASVEIGSGSRRPLPLPITEFTRVDDGDGDPYWTADQPVAANPQTVGPSNALGGTLSSLLGSLDLSASDPNHPNESSQICVQLFICIPVGTILDTVLDSIEGTLGSVLASVALLDSLLDPLLEALGIQLGSTTVTMNAAQISQPYIATQDRPPAEP